MNFTPEQFSKITEALRGKRIIEKCPACAHNNFVIQDGLVMLAIQPPQQGMTLGGPALPNLPLICSNCGYTFLFNVFVLGVAELLGIKPGEKKEVPANG